MMIKAQQSWVKHCDTPKYKEGDQVWLGGKNLCLNQPTAKLAPRRHGPFKVIKVLLPVSYQLQLPTQWSIHPVFHINLLTPYQETIMHGPNYQCPLPNLVNGEEEYSVEKILDSQLFGRRLCLQYLVKWDGYPDSDNMWVDKDDVFANNKVQEFKQSNPDKQTHIRTLHYVDSVHSPTPPLSHLFTQHAHKYMSSDGDSDLAHEYPAGAYDDTTARDDLLDNIHQAIIDAATSHTANQLRLLSQPVLLNESYVPLDPTAVPFKPRSPSPSAQSIANAFRQLSIHTPARLTPDRAAAAEAIRHTHMKFLSPLLQLLGMQTVQAWHQEHLAMVQKKFNKKNQRHIAAGHIPIHHPYLTSHTAPSVTDLENTATDTQTPASQHSQSQCCQHPYLSQLQLFQPTEWQHLTSIMSKPRHWQLDSPLHSNKTVKIPLKYHLHTQSKKKLPKGWVYVDKEVKAEVKAEVIDLSKYCRVLLLLSPDPLSPADLLTAPTSVQETCTWPAKLGHKVMKRTLEDNMFHSVSPASMAKKPQHASSRST
jgi:hypothetical protein